MCNCFSEFKKISILSVVFTAFIIFACYLTFDLHIANRIRGILGLHVPTLVVLDEVPTTLYFNKVVPFSKQTGIPIGTFVREGGVVDWQSMAGKTLEDSLSEGIEVVPVLKTLPDDVTMGNSELLDDKIAKEKQFFDQAGLNTDYFGYSWIYNQAKQSYPHMSKYCKAAIYYCGGVNSFNKIPISDNYMMSACIVGHGKLNWADDAIAFVDGVNISDSLGILVIQSWRSSQFTDQEFKRFAEVLRYAKNIGVRIVTLREAMKK